MVTVTGWGVVPKYPYHILHGLGKNGEDSTSSRLHFQKNWGWSGNQSKNDTRPKFNIAPEISLPNRKVVFQPPFFRGYVTLPGVILLHQVWCIKTIIKHGSSSIKHPSIDANVRCADAANPIQRKVNIILKVTKKKVRIPSKVTWTSSNSPSQKTTEIIVFLVWAFHPSCSTTILTHQESLEDVSSTEADHL